MRTTRPAAVALALCLGMAAGLPAVWQLTRPTANVGSRPLADASPPSRKKAESPPATAAVLGSAASPPRNLGAGAVPTRVRIQAVGVDAVVVPVGVAPDGAMRIPRDARRVGWYRFGPRPAGGAGSVVLAAHVDSRTQGLGVFFPLRDLDPGDRVTVVTDDRGRSTYRVVSRKHFRKRALPLEDLFRRDGPEVLTLITCGGRYLADAGGYQDNAVVSAVPVRS